MEYLGLIGLGLGLATFTRWFWRAWAVNVPKNTSAFQAVAITGASLGAIALYKGHPDPFAGWAVGVGLLFIYFSTTGAQKVSNDGIRVGDTLPAFSGVDDKDATFESSSLAGSRVLLKFFRGHW